jgi:hypothetical protein
MNVADIAGLAKLRRWAGRRLHNEESLVGRIVTLARDGLTVGQIICSTLALARTAEQICYGLRLRRENAEAWMASELAALNEPMALAA